MTLKATARLTTKCTLGEGIAWHDASEAWPISGFFFVDIHGRQLHFVEEGWGGHRVWDTPERIGWLIASSRGDGFLAGFQSGVAKVTMTPTLSVRKWVCRPFASQPSLRLNDAKADATGRIWAGSLNNDDESLDDGALYCIRPDGRAELMDSGYKVANGPAISPDGKLFLHTDSARRTIYAFDFDSSAGTLNNKRVWRVLDAVEGFPDGMNFDAEGSVWVAHWGAGMVSRFSRHGELLARVTLPASNITNLAFGGASLDRLLVTTARAGLTEEQLAQQPLAGSLFEITGHGTRGLKPMKAVGG
jgi:sugar lactone lactonase YvrE